MAGFESSIGKKSLNQLRSFEVDEEESLSKVHEDFEVQRKEKVFGKERLPESAKKRIEVLLGMTTLTKEVSVGKTSFVLRTLRSNEVRTVLKTASPLDGTWEFGLEIRRQVLARSIVKVNSTDVDVFLNSDSLESRLGLVDSLDEPVVKLLHKTYEELAKEANEFYGVSDEVEAKVLVEEIKK
ncbi:MAG: hypothetical protein LC122_13165 [Chitinophagales bacterium]|nr:hypothetical protein [Chitinophagales bacterium]